MATKEKSAPGAKAPKGEGKKKKGGEATAARGPHAGAGKPVPAPRLREFYQSTVRERLMKQFGLTNPHQVPTISRGSSSAANASCQEHTAMIAPMRAQWSDDADFASRHNLPILTASESVMRRSSAMEGDIGRDARGDRSRCCGHRPRD